MNKAAVQHQQESHSLPSRIFLASSYCSSSINALSTCQTSTHGIKARQRVSRQRVSSQGVSGQMVSRQARQLVGCQMESRSRVRCQLVSRHLVSRHLVSRQVVIRQPHSQTRSHGGVVMVGMEYIQVPDRRSFATSPAAVHRPCTDMKPKGESRAWSLYLSGKDVEQAHESPRVRMFKENDKISHSHGYAGHAVWMADKQSPFWLKQMARPRDDEGRLLVEPDKVPQGNAETDCRLGWEALRLSMLRMSAQRDRTAQRSISSTTSTSSPDSILGSAVDGATSSSAPGHAEEQPIKFTYSQSSQTTNQPIRTSQGDGDGSTGSLSPAMTTPEPVFKKPGLPASATKPRGRKAVPAPPLQWERSINPAELEKEMDLLITVTKPVSLPSLPPLSMARALSPDYLHMQRSPYGDPKWPPATYPPDFELAASKVKQWHKKGVKPSSARPSGRRRRKLGNVPKVHPRYLDQGSESTLNGGLYGNGSEAPVLPKWTPINSPSSES
ncbi:hypothetical protein EJ03DRAFT_193954 [Teratosphaeria nubilosa]|uniref:Uncharacterized protein n=1 Tax=Teratosphaeria nubilosa TaxID=161662 RepID=A0A6G1L0K5_9PEZI|nr:hypothetical protein EJ03DRAFT_193954 [Teratosphaeria nubilosa]